MSKHASHSQKTKIECSFYRNDVFKMSTLIKRSDSFLCLCRFVLLPQTSVMLFGCSGTASSIIPTQTHASLQSGSRTGQIGFSLISIFCFLPSSPSPLPPEGVCVSVEHCAFLSSVLSSFFYASLQACALSCQCKSENPSLCDKVGHCGGAIFPSGPGLCRL